MEKEREAEMGAYLRRKSPLIRLFALPLAMAAALGALIVWHDASALDLEDRAVTVLAVEKVLDPDRMYMPAPVREPLLMEGEDLRYPTAYRDETAALAAGEGDIYRGFLMLVNDRRVLPEGYQPEDPVAAGDMPGIPAGSGFAVSRGGMQIDRTAAEHLFAMLGQASENDGVKGYLLQSGLRDFAYQQLLHQNKVREYRNRGYAGADAEKAAAFWVTRPRESEHHTGLALDLTSRGHPGLLTGYGQTANGKWLAENAWRFGFIIRYPEDKSEITHIGFEPWHLRYVGRPHSDFIYGRKWCLEEYMDFLETEGGYTFRDEYGNIWQIDYLPAGEGPLRVPAGRPYTLSGDGGQGFVLTTLMEAAEITETAETAEEMAAAEEAEADTSDVSGVQDTAEPAAAEPAAMEPATAADGLTAIPAAGQ